ncbi:uncharacterized protein [Dermacentor andersoni]|uniref:uncharacterized protein isoform X5 n=1 Tax=Dermacentor andersoni TaxID=34620 RepID=UPI0024160155|nr:uncharacterized protein LOC126544574 isoform X5 [Dermacentor andersoni]
MGTLVTYRDLPGGPMKIKFADEISRHCLCRQCHMLSLCMYSDSASHMFCDDCLNDQSYKHQKYEIYCPDEGKDVSLAQMFQARDLVTILCDQYVECPNQPKCTVKLPLGQLEKHYIECKEMSSIKCTKCGHKVPSTSWMQHKTDCQPTCDNELPRKKSDHRDGKRKPPPASSASLPVSASRENGSAKNTTAAPSALYPSSLLPDATTGEFDQQFQSLGSASTSTQPPVKSQGPASIETEKTTCKHCRKNVKKFNMPRHLEVCYDVEAPCPYCDKNVARKDMKAHTEECMRKFEETREASDAAAATSGNSKKSKKTKVAPPKPKENPPHLRNNSDAKKMSKTSMTLEAKGTSAKTTSHTEQELQLCSGWSTDVSAWLPYATAGNWYTAYVAMEEQFKDTGTDQAARHAHFVPKLVALKYDHFVRDFIDAPYEPQPFDCLITALFVRACIPFNVWAQRSKVTWQDVLKYLPTVLHSRLSVGAKLYLQEHPVFFEDNGYHNVDEVGTVAVNALIPGHTPSVTSSDPVTTETEALDVPEVDMRDVAGAQKQELGPPQVLGKKEEAQHSKETRKLSIADLLDDFTSTIGPIGIHEIFSEIDFRGEAGCVKTHDQTQRDLSVEGTYGVQGDDPDRPASGLINGLVASERESNTTFQNTSRSHHLGPSADEPMNYLAATKASSHSTVVEQPCRLTYTEAGKVPNPMPTTTGAFNHGREDGQKSCHQKRGSYEVSDTCSYKTRSSICEDKPAYSVVAEGRKMNPRSVTGYMPGEVPSSQQPNKGFSSETKKEDSKPNYVTGSPVPRSFSEEVPPTLLNSQHEKNEIVQADALGSANANYERSRGISSQTSRIEHFREKGGYVKTPDQTQQELSEGTYERQCDETGRSVRGLGSGFVSSEQKSYTAFENATPSHHSGPSADEPMKYLAATKATSHSSGDKEPCRRTCAEAFKESNQTPATTGAFNDDPDDEQESCHLKSGSHEVSDTCSYNTRSSICEGKPAYSAAAEDSNINPHSFAGHIAGGVPSSHQPNKGVSFETTKEDSKPNYFTGSPVPGIFSKEVPPTLLNAQHEENEIIQADALGSANTKYETSRGISSQYPRIERFREKGAYVKTHDQTQQESSEGTYERQCDETERSLSGLDSGLVSSEQKSNTAFQNATPSHHSGPSADEPMKYLAPTKASSHSTGGKEPRRMTFAEVVKKSYPTPTATAAFTHDRDDGHESCHRKRGSYVVSDSYAYKIGRSDICEDKPANSVVSEDRQIFSKAIAGHIGGGARLCRQPNKGFSTETTDEDIKPTCVTGSPLPGSSSEEVPPTPLNLQRQDNEIRQVDALRSSTTKYERSGRRPSQNAWIVSNSSMTQKHDNIGVREERRAGLTNTETRCTPRKAVASFSHPEPTEKSPVGTFYTAKVNLEMKSTEKHGTANFPERLDFYSCASCNDSWEENDDHLKPKASKHCYESRSNNQKPSQGSWNRCQNSEISQACDEDQAKVEKSACSEADTIATVQDSTHLKNDVDPTAPAPEFEASTYDQLKSKGTGRGKFQKNIPCSLQLTCDGDTFADLHRAHTVQRSSQQLYSQAADSPMNTCSRILEQAEQSVNDVAKNQEN